MDMMGAMMGAGGQGSKYAPKEKETIPDKYEAMLAQDNLTPAHRATLEKMARRRVEREAKQARRPQSGARGVPAPLNPAWDTSFHRIHSAPWEDRSKTFKERAAEREAERRGALESFRDSRVHSRGLSAR